MNEIYKPIYDEYITDLERLGYMERGIKGISSRLKRYFIYLEEMGLTLIQVKMKEAQGYQGWLYQYGERRGVKYKNSSIKPYITATVSFYGFLKRTNRIYTNPFKEIRRAKIEKTLPKNLLKEKEMNTFLKELSKFEKENCLTPKITRFKVWIVSEIMYATGLRISEVANLKPDHIDFDRGLINVIDGKMGLNRVCYLNEYAEKLLQIYINEFRELTFNYWNKKNSHLLFGVKWSNFEKTVNKVLRRVSAKLKYPHFTSHNFRHCLGFHLLRSGCDIRYIQAILGHKLLRNTEVYTQVDKEDLKKVFDRYHPRTYLKRGKTNDKKKS